MNAWTRVILLLTTASLTDAWILSHPSNLGPTRVIRVNNVPFTQLQVSSSSSSNNGVDTIRLDSLGEDHEAVGTAMGESVARWLDAEWMPQDIHRQIGESAAASYVKVRNAINGNSNSNMDSSELIMTIMTTVADDLTEEWYERYDRDAFVNAWDVANYVSDYLTKQSGNEGCECSAQIH